MLSALPVTNNVKERRKGRDFWSINFFKFKTELKMRDALRKLHLRNPRYSSASIPRMTQLMQTSLFFKQVANLSVVLHNKRRFEANICVGGLE